MFLSNTSPRGSIVLWEMYLRSQKFYVIGLLICSIDSKSTMYGISVVMVRQPEGYIEDKAVHITTGR